MSRAGRRIAIGGTVQGVGFRPWVWRLARETGVAGRVSNGPAGVTIEAFAETAVLDGFLSRLRAEGPPAARVATLTWEAIAVEPVSGFEIAESGGAAERRPSIPADLATCPECLAEVLDPANRRYRYPFTNCTNCGPRFTIARDVPYDRATTTMAAFPMCPDCEREYREPADRRFHAQPNACPVCGPRLQLWTAQGEPLPVEDPLRFAAQALEAGLVVAVKGLGGFHLACDATLEPAVARLRARKWREAKPFAVMVRDLEAAEALAELGEGERAMLAGPERPIVLAPLRVGHALAPSVAPGLDLVGLLLPYTPLHHLLLADVGHPLVMTSGNLSDEPITYRDEEAVARLGGIADLLLVHDREVAAPCEDSVGRVVAGAPLLVRRSRGYVPAAIPLPRPVPRPVLAVGGDLKAVACLAAGDHAWLTPHLGDLASPDSLAALAEAVERLEAFLGITPEVVAYDPHPGYHSTRWARSLPAAARVPVQHHHAHVAACLAEHGCCGPALGVTFDGTGWGPAQRGMSEPGPDGAAWGGELLLADLAGYERVATLRPMRLPGGEAALREVWRLGLAVLDDAFDGEPPLSAVPLFAELPADRVAAVRRLLAAGVNSPPAHGAGRWFDAAAALALGVPLSRYEGEAALRLERAACRAGAATPYPFAFTTAGAPWQVDLRPAVRALVRDLAAGRGGDRPAARFHGTLAAAVEAMVRAAAERHGRLPVVLTGGCFQNPLLAEAVAARLGGDFPLLLHRLVPPGDGGLALGQAVVAAAQIARPVRTEDC